MSGVGLSGTLSTLAIAPLRSNNTYYPLREKRVITGFVKEPTSSNNERSETIQQSIISTYINIIASKKRIYWHKKKNIPWIILRNILKYCFNLLLVSVMRKATLSFLLLLSANLLLAQESGTDFFRNIGKIYVVVAIIVVTFIGIAMFLFYMEKKVRRLERELNEWMSEFWMNEKCDNAEMR